MFTGLISSLGTVHDVGSAQLVVAASGLDEPPGASIAVNGCCLTVAGHPGDSSNPAGARLVRFDLLPETLEHTNLGALRRGDRVNLEPAMRAGAAFGGHWVQGHVDATGVVALREELPTALDLRLQVPDEVLRYCVERGSIAVNGVSLTVMELLPDGIRVQLIPETRTRTNLGHAAPGDPVNLEADILARYVERLAVRPT